MQRSLNYTKRMKDFAQIELDNLALAKRLAQRYFHFDSGDTCRKPHIDVENLSKDYESHCRYKEVVMKVPLKTAQGKYVPILTFYYSRRGKLLMRRLAPLSREEPVDFSMF